MQYSLKRGPRCIGSSEKDEKDLGFDVFRVEGFAIVSPGVEDASIMSVAINGEATHPRTDV